MTTYLTILLMILPITEARIVERVAIEYQLTTDQMYLLAAIRLTEQGKTPIEFGVGQEYPGHKARRYTYSPVRSFWTQCRWASGTVKKHYTGDIDAFSKIYCPKNHESWAANVKVYMNKQHELERKYNASINIDQPRSGIAGK